MNLTEDQLKQIEIRFGLTPKKVYKVRDGEVGYGEPIWWRKESGPKQITAEDWPSHIDNINRYPKCYSRKKPKYRVIYED